jgi:hypothetical protein
MARPFRCSAANTGGYYYHCRCLDGVSVYFAFTINRNICCSARVLSMVGDRAVLLRSLILPMAVAITIAACSHGPEYSDEQRVCIAQRYKEYDARKLSQCVDVCKSCMKGNNITCNTSCKLKGAS